MNEWVWSICRIILTGQNQNRKKPDSVPLSPPQIPYRLANKWTRASVVRGPGLTVKAIYLQWEKWPKNAFYCVDRPRCVVLQVACYKYRLCTVWEIIQQKLAHSCSVWSWLCTPNIAYPILGLFSSISSIHHCWLRNSLSKLPKTPFWWQLDDSKKLSHNFSASN
jgi:hypothetical protein